MRGNVYHTFNKWITVNSNINFTRSDNNFVPTSSGSGSGSGVQGILRTALIFLPTNPLFDPSENTAKNNELFWLMANPTYYVHNLKNDLTTNQLFTSNSVELQLLPYLKFRQNVGFNYSLNEQEDMHIANSVKLADYGITAGAASRYVVKFEVNVTADWTSDPLRIWWKSKTGTFNYNFPWGGGNFNGAAYKTTGWKTVTIPLADFIYSEDDAGAKKGQKVTTLDAESVGQALETRLFIQGPDAKKLNVYWDNFRIVPKY